MIIVHHKHTHRGEVTLNDHSAQQQWSVPRAAHSFLRMLSRPSAQITVVNSTWIEIRTMRPLSETIDQDSFFGITSELGILARAAGFLAQLRHRGVPRLLDDAHRSGLYRVPLITAQYPSMAPWITGHAQQPWDTARVALMLACDGANMSDRDVAAGLALPWSDPPHLLGDDHLIAALELLDAERQRDDGLRSLADVLAICAPETVPAQVAVPPSS
ncbi:hypothetical protein HY632_04895 [Candidatus Uhrbacteria bacterium]|nr:hypothetical protein [Candidatus Uhrbacteria bacterium]